MIGVGELVDDRAKPARIFEKRCDIAKQYTRTWEVRDYSYQRLDIDFLRHMGFQRSMN